MRAFLDSRRAMTVSCALALALIAATACPTALADDAPAGPPGLPPDILTLLVAPTSAEFRPVPDAPNTWEAGPFEVEATCPLRTWAVLIEVSALGHDRAGHLIPSERIRLVPLAEADRAGDAARPLAGPVPVLEGGIGTRTGPVGRATFLLRVVMDWTDPAGNYVGTIRFSYFAAP